MWGLQVSGEVKTLVYNPKMVHHVEDRASGYTKKTTVPLLPIGLGLSTEHIYVIK
jgi:hypothetical protein